MIQFLKWGEKHYTGIALFDDHHKKEIELLNGVIAAVNKNLWHGEIFILLNEFFEHLAFHFDSEEEMLKAHEFPYYKRHKQEHDKLRSGIKEYHRKCEEGDAPTIIEMLNVASSWFEGHILNEDKNYGSFLIERGMAD